MRRSWLLKEITSFAKASLIPPNFHKIRQKLSNPTTKQLAGDATARSQGKGNQHQTKGKGKGKAKGKSKDPAPESKLAEVPGMPSCASFPQDMGKGGNATREEGSDLQLQWMGA